MGADVLLGLLVKDKVSVDNILEFHLACANWAAHIFTFEPRLA
jgi:hypothetical protein